MKKRFEYLSVETTPGQDGVWQKLGAEGWELIAVQPVRYAITVRSPMELSILMSRLIFKREQTA